MAPRRQYGTGSVFQRADGKWVGRVEAGFTKNGRTQRTWTVLEVTGHRRRSGGGDGDDA